MYLVRIISASSLKSPVTVMALCAQGALVFRGGCTFSPGFAIILLTSSNVALRDCSSHEDMRSCCCITSGGGVGVY